MKEYWVLQWLSRALQTENQPCKYTLQHCTCSLIDSFNWLAKSLVAGFWGGGHCNPLCLLAIYLVAMSFLTNHSKPLLRRRYQKQIPLSYVDIIITAYLALLTFTLTYRCRAKQ